MTEVTHPTPATFPRLVVVEVVALARLVLIAAVLLPVEPEETALSRPLRDQVSLTLVVAGEVTVRLATPVLVELAVVAREELRTRLRLAVLPILVVGAVEPLALAAWVALVVLVLSLFARSSVAQPQES